MPGVTKEQIQAAREADLFTYLQFHEPGVLKQDGPNFRHKEHDSLVYVTGKRYWYWNSRGLSINALDYLIQIRGYGLVDAVHALVGGEIPQEPAYRSTAAVICPTSSKWNPTRNVELISTSILRHWIFEHRRSAGNWTEKYSL